MTGSCSANGGAGHASQFQSFGAKRACCAEPKPATDGIPRRCIRLLELRPPGHRREDLIPNWSVDEDGIVAARLIPAKHGN